MEKEYDFLIVGAGLYGSVFAYEAKKTGKKCLVVEKREHTGGNIYCRKINGIIVHEYGAHIFHTNDRVIWDYVNSFVSFNSYINSPLASYKGRLYNLPFNMNTFYQLWGIKNPDEVKKKIVKQVTEANIISPKNLEEQALVMVGRDIYEIFIKGYTEKQWGRKASELPAFIIKRIPLRFSFNNNYFNDRYQGIPEGGYNLLIKKLLNGIEVKLSVDYLKNRDELNLKSKYILFTGSLDAFYDFRFGMLNYRSLRFIHKLMDTNNYQGNAVINYTDTETAYTRTIEHQYFDAGTIGKHHQTVVTWEYPQEYNGKNEPCYPINDEYNMNIYKKYRQLADHESNLIFGGRLADYRYYDMHQVIAAALKKARSVLTKESNSLTYSNMMIV